MENKDYLNQLLELLNVSEEKKDRYCEKLRCVDEYTMEQNLSLHDTVVLSTGLLCTLIMLLDANICPEDRMSLMKDAHGKWSESRAKNPGLNDQQFFYEYYIGFLARQN
jgi:hypothetical protein